MSTNKIIKIRNKNRCETSSMMLHSLGQLQIGDFLNYQVLMSMKVTEVYKGIPLSYNSTFKSCINQIVLSYASSRIRSKRPPIYLV